MAILNNQQIGKARKLWREGKNTVEIAAELRLPESVIYNGRSYFVETTPRTLAGKGIVSVAAHEGSSPVASTLRRSEPSCPPTQDGEKLAGAIRQ